MLIFFNKIKDNYMDTREIDLFLENVLDIGKWMVQSGAEVGRAEDTMMRICLAYDFQDVEVYALTTLIIVTIKSQDDLHYTQSTRVGSVSNNLGRMAALNAVSRSICENKPNITAFHDLIKKALFKTKLRSYNSLGYIIASFAFTLFFGGDLLDSLCAGFVGYCIYLIDAYIDAKDTNKFIYTTIVSFLTGCLAIILYKIGLASSWDKVMIGVVMLFIPTLALVNGTNDIFHRDIIAGVYRIIEALIIGVSVAIGFSLAIAFLGGI